MDQRTLRFYAQEAGAYTSRGQVTNLRYIEPFLAMLPPKASILELGCGAGQDTELMIAKGFKVCPTDGTPEIAKAAERRLGIPVATLLFGDLDEDSTYDGIWANACLLHVPKAELSGILGRIHRALKIGGLSMRASQPVNRTAEISFNDTTIIHPKTGLPPCTTHSGGKR